MTAPLIVIVLLVGGFLVLLAVMAWWPKLWHRYLARINEEQAADQACARLRNVEGGRRT